MAGCEVNDADTILFIGLYDGLLVTGLFCDGLFDGLFDGLLDGLFCIWFL